MGVTLFRVFNFVIYFLSCTFFGVFVSFCLHRRFTKLSKLKEYLIFNILIFIPNYLKFWYSSNQTIVTIAYYVVLIVIVTYITVFFKDAWWKKLCCFLSSMMMGYLAETLIFSFAGKVGLEFNHYFSDIDSLIIMLLDYFLLTMMGLIYYFFWNQLVNRESNYNKNINLFTIFLLSQAFIFDGITHSINYFDFEVSYVSDVLAIVISFIADINIFFFIKKQNEQNKLNEQMAIAQRNNEIEWEKYRALTTKQESIRKLRHDMNNEVMTLAYLLEHGETKKAEAIVKRMKEGVVENE